MKILKVFVKIIILVQIWNIEAATMGSLFSRQANRKQKKLIEGSMDLRANPCDDFYQYACGNWKQVHLEAGTQYYEPITLLDYNVNMEMSRVLKRISLKNKPKFVKEVFNYYKSCVNLDKYESIKYLSWLKLNDQFKWPALWTQPKVNVQFDWLKTLAKMRTYGLNDVLIQEVVRRKMSDKKAFIIDLDKPVMDDGFKPITFENLKVLMESLPAPMTKSALQKLWKEIEEFEQNIEELDKIEDDEIETVEEYNEKRVVLAKDLPLPWLKDYLKIILNQTELNPLMELYLQNVPYMKALDTLIQQYDQRFLCKYLEIRFLWFLHQQGPTNFVDKDCVANIRSQMPTAMHWLYEQQHPELQQSYNNIYEIFNNVRKLFNNTVNKNNHGFNNTVVEYLQQKILKMKFRLNNIPRVDTVATLEKFYSNLNFDSTTFYENHLQLLKFNFKFHLDILQPKDTILDLTYQENAETGSSSSPYFIQNSNTVVVPLTLLQHPIFHADLDDIYKYSSLGFLLAHEIFHGFDDSGLLIDANGNLALFDFQENSIFNASLNCLLELNPAVISEKIADISGLHYAYKVFFDSSSDALNQTRRIYGQELPASKVFFLNFAQFFCGNITPEVFDSMSDHGSDRERVIDALTHFPEFSKSFQCTTENRLYPHEACHLWSK